MKAYKVLKNWSGIAAGTISINRNDAYLFKTAEIDGINEIHVPLSLIKANPDLFEEVDVPARVFTIEDMNISWNRAWNNDVSIFHKFIENEYPQHIDELQYLK